MQITWGACHDPAAGISHRCTWIGATRQIVVTGLPPSFAADAPRSFELPADANVHEVPRGADGFDLARRLGGVLFTMHGGNSGALPRRDSGALPRRDTSTASADRFRRSYEARLGGESAEQRELEARLDKTMLDQISHEPRRVSEIFTDARRSFGRVGTRQLFESFARLRAAGHVTPVADGYVRVRS